MSSCYNNSKNNSNKAKTANKIKIKTLKMQSKVKISKIKINHSKVNSPHKISNLNKGKSVLNQLRPSVQTRR